MHAFLFLAVPATVLWYIFSDRKRSPVSYIIPVTAGIFSATAYTIIIKFIVTLNEKITDSPAAYIAMLNTRYNLLPVLIICLAYFFISRDSLDFRAKSFVPLALSFEEICCSYFVIGNQEKGSFFLLICLPALIASSYLGAGALLEKAASTFTNNSKDIARTAAFSIAAVILISLVSVVQALWFFNKAAGVYTIFTILLFAAGILTAVLLREKNPDKSPEL
ncbi:hypothetical protein [Treponema sp.]|uniref:hypothetical protein n=1 Tax=Treponema sp. TaxID=166 RepID=UPI0025FB2184|nr:hypothetical protein [Treponema sp.]MCR5217179.1 hypothetical protein [Treponema sp.]